MSRIRGEFVLDPKYEMLLEQRTWNPITKQLVSVAWSATIPNGKEMFTLPHSVVGQSSPCRSAAVVGAAVARIRGNDHHAHAVQSEETRESHDEDGATAMDGSIAN